MTDVLETLILNPVEFVPELPEIALDALDLEVAKDGLDFGESNQTVERVRQAIGEGITDAHWPSVGCSVPLIARGSDELPIADPLHRLEGWVAEVQRRRSGWIRRDFSEAGGFAGSVGCPVDMAGLTPAQGWTFAHRQVAPSIILKLSRHPLWFATVEIESEEFQGASVRDLQFEIAKMLGTAPGLIRVMVKNEGTEDWRGAIVSLECDDYSAAATALPRYDAAELTPQGGAEVVPAFEAVKCPPLTEGPVTVLSSEIAGVGHMTHAGPRRMMFRVAEAGFTLGEVQWTLQWRALGAANWIQTTDGSTARIVTAGNVGGQSVLDLGECRPERAIVGEQRWEWRLQARSVHGTGVQPLLVTAYPASAEQWLRVADTSPEGNDGRPEEQPGTVEDATGVGTVAWENAANAKTLGSGYASATNLGKEATTSHYLKATGFGFSIPDGVTVVGILVSVSRRSGHFKGALGITDARARIIMGGTIKATEDKASEDEWLSFFGAQNTTYGGYTDRWGQTWTPSDINSSGFGFALAAELSYNSGTEEGATAEVDSITIAVAYSEGPEENRICFASRSIEFADNEVRRQHVTDDVWGGLMPEGFLPYSPPSGQSGQPMRGLIIPSVGDFDTRADSASVKLSAKVAYRPSYIFSREAAE